MVDRVSAAITIGGQLSPAFLHEFLALVAEEGLSTEWDGEPFTASQLVSGIPLKLRAHEVANGQFIPLEDFCVAHGLPFRRWCGGCANWGPQRAVFDGTGTVNYLTLNEGGMVLIDRRTIDNLGSMEAISAWFDAADLEVPPLAISPYRPGSMVPILVRVGALLPPASLEQDDRAVPGAYAIALDPADIGRPMDTAGLVERAKDMFHNAVAIGNLDDFAIEVQIVASPEAVPAAARWLTAADAILPRRHEAGENRQG